MHVAMLSGSLSCGGSERVLVNLAEYLTKKGHKVTMVTTFVNENEYDVPSGVSRIVSGLTKEEESSSRIRNVFRRFSKLSGIWKDIKPDVILSFIGKNNFNAILTGKKAKIPVAVSIRANPEMEYYNIIMKLLSKTLFVRADKVIVQTKDQLLYFPPYIRRKAIIMKNPVNPEFMVEPYDGIREKTIVTVGRVDDNKNHKLIIDAFAGISEKYPDYRVIIYGEGDKRSELKEYVKSLGLENRIELPGRVLDVPGTIKKAGVFVLSSDMEGSPNALIEAMVLGLPAISTDCPCGGPSELIEDGVNGLLIPVGNRQKMQDCLQKIINDLQFANRLGENALKTRDIYSPEKVLENWENLLESLAK